MTLEDQVTSLELSKRLKELGVKQEYQPYDAYWVKLSNGEWRLMFLETQEDPPTQTPFEHCRALTVAELGQMLWDAFEKRGWHQFFFVYGEVFGFKGTSFVGELGIINFMRKPDMGAKMLIYLIENNLLTPSS